MGKSNKLLYITQAAIIAAVYVLLTVLPVLNAISYGPVQFRLSEALTVLPFIWPAAVPGVALGCLIANMFSPFPWDMLIGTFATLLAALCTHWIGKRKIKGALYLAALPPVIINALIIGAELTVFTHIPFIYNFLSVGVGQLTVCFLLGIPLTKIAARLKIFDLK
ncbi:MAG TPA: QueT transporter family protein [Clostridia bacterium]|nr:QueT transporter family protein [Clostridia bacterium]